MKYSLFVILLAPLCMQAQDCKLKRTTDPYTKEIKLSTGLIQLDAASLSIDADSKEIDFFFSMSGSEKCFDDASMAVVVYDSVRQKGNFKSGGPVNCEGFFHIIFKNTATTNTLLQRLITQKITSIQFNGTNKTKTLVMFSDDEKKMIMAKADCIIKEAKTLIK